MTKSSGWALILGLLAIIAAMALKPALLSLPEVAEPAPGAFDTLRALDRLQRVLASGRPHPVDSDANDQVRARLVRELIAIGLRPRISDSFTCNPNARSRVIACARIRNVVATTGPAGGDHLLLVSHYDSTPVGVGAADDGIGMATMLEVAALLQRQPPRRPVTFLFNEGEEAGLIGARAFLDHDPIASRIDTLVNLEARGVSGPALMFETSRPNAAAIALYRRSVARPAANSLSADFYAMIPNSTDVDVFRPRGWTILNFAVIGNETRYHSAGDDLAALDPRSLRHMGDQTLSIVRTATADASAPASGTGEMVYADVLGRTMVLLPFSAAALALALLFAGSLILLVRQGRAGWGAAGSVLLALIAAGALTWGVQAMVGALRPGDYWRAHPTIIAFAIDMTALAAAGLVLVLAAHRADRRALRAASWFVILLIGAGLTWQAPGAAIFFLAPPASGLVAAAMSRRWPTAAGFAAWVAILLLFLTIAPLLTLTGTLLGYGAGWVLASVAALVLLPALVELAPGLSRISATPLLLLPLPALLGWAAVAAAPSYSEDRQQAFGIEHVTDVAAGSARWMITNDGAPLPEAYGAYRAGTKVPWSTRPRWSAPAPASPDSPQPSLDLIGTETRSGNSIRRFSLSTGGAEAITLRIPGEARLLLAQVNTSRKPFGRGRRTDPYLLHCRGRACNGATITLLRPEGAPIRGELIGFRFALPPSAQALQAARPRHARPQYSPDQQVVVTRFTI